MSMYDDDFGDEYDDDFGFDDDEFGISERRVARLLKRKARLTSLLPIVGARRQKRIQRRIARIDRVLARTGYTQEAAAAAAAVAASGIEGVGGLMFQAQSPPGLGRLLRLPFYPTTANAQTTTSAGAGAASSTNPIMLEIPAAAAISAGSHILTTPQISWATLRIVGFETQMQAFKGISNPGPTMVCSDLQIGGGANLFTHEDFADAGIYDADQPEFCGLRDYPVLRSPNTAQVTVASAGDNAAETVTFSASLLVEALLDQQFGAHVPGPYARKGALVRQGGSFV